MKRKLRRPATALLTFALGAACAASFRELTSHRPEISLADPTPRISLSDEAALRAHLSRLRGLIDRYQAGQQRYPQSLDDLVRVGYLGELPVDPMTGEREWRPDGLVCPTGRELYFFAVTDVYSRSDAISSDGTRYGEW